MSTKPVWRAKSIPATTTARTSRTVGNATELYHETSPEARSRDLPLDDPTDAAAPATAVAASAAAVAAAISFPFIAIVVAAVRLLISVG